MTADEFSKSFVEIYNSLSNSNYEITRYSYDPQIPHYPITDPKKFWNIHDSVLYVHIYGSYEFCIRFDDEDRNTFYFRFEIPIRDYHLIELTLLKLGFTNSAFTVSYLKASSSERAFFETFEFTALLNDIELMQYILDLDLYDKFLTWAEYNKMFKDDRDVNIKSVLEKVLMDDKAKNIHADTRAVIMKYINDKFGIDELNLEL